MKLFFIFVFITLIAALLKRAIKIEQYIITVVADYKCSQPKTTIKLSNW
ncbi:MAG: hypothetical protein E6799_00015 [Dialister micraerophilus]|nr:hypothetical protein [Dialister micraerophilus]